MSGRGAGEWSFALVSLLGACACAPAGRTGVSAADARQPSARAAAPEPARFFQGLPEDAFWVTHDARVDRVVEGGARLELAPTGEVIAAAWDVDASAAGEQLLGSLAVPARLGGGFVHWSRAKVFRSREFTGPLEPVAVGAVGEAGVRGARSWIDGVIVVTEAGPRALRPGSSRLEPLRHPAVLDAVSVGARALRLDVFGRASASNDGGKSWLDLSPTAGVAGRSVGATPTDLLIETWQGRFTVAPSGELAPFVAPRSSNESSKLFQIVWEGARAYERDRWPGGWRDATPLQAAVMSGAALGDGTALGVIQHAVSRVDLATGELVGLATDWIASGLACQPMRADDGVLFACTWDHYRGDGGYVLRSASGEPPELERAFTDGGSFVASDDGALGYTGSCTAAPRLVDPDDPARRRYSWRAPPVKRVFCVRKAPGVWVERTADPGEGASLVAWVPQKGGGAVALAMTREALPAPSRGGGPHGLARPPRVIAQGGVRVVRLERDIAGWSFARPQWQLYGRGGPNRIDRRFRANDDGSIDAWLGPSGESYLQIAVGATVRPDGTIAVHELPPAMVGMVFGGSSGVAVSRRGELFESVDHGRSWRAAGIAPAPLGAYGGSRHVGCSPLGCAMGGVVRLGWGASKLASVALSRRAAPRGSNGARNTSVCVRSTGADGGGFFADPGAPGGRGDGASASRRISTDAP